MDDDIARLKAEEERLEAWFDRLTKQEIELHALRMEVLGALQDARLECGSLMFEQQKREAETPRQPDRRRARGEETR